MYGLYNTVIVRYGNFKIRSNRYNGNIDNKEWIDYGLRYILNRGIDHVTLSHIPENTDLRCLFLFHEYSFSFSFDSSIHYYIP